MSINLKFSKAIYEGRMKLGLTQEQTAEIVSISHRWYQHIENGDTLSSAEVFLRLILRSRLMLKCSEMRQD